MDPGTTFDRATLDNLAALANSKEIEGRPYKFWGRLHVFYCETADNPEVLASIPSGKNLNQIPAFDSKATSWFSVSVGDIAINLQTNEAFRLDAYPQTDFANWTKLTSAEFVVKGNQPPGTPGKAWYNSNEIELNLAAGSGGLRSWWDQLYIFRDGVWDIFGGWMMELNRMRHALQRKCANNDPTKVTTPAYLIEGLISTGPWVLAGGINELPFIGSGTGAFSVGSGGFGPRILNDFLGVSNWPSGHQISDFQVWWSDEVHASVLPTYRIMPEWSYQRISDVGRVDGDISGFRYEGPAPATFNAWMYTNTDRGHKIDCSHPGMLKEFKGVDHVAVGMPPNILFNWRADAYAVNGVRIEGTLNPGETFWMQMKADEFGSVRSVGTDGGTGGYNGDTIRARFVPAFHPEIDFYFEPTLTRASVGEPFALYVLPQVGPGKPNTGVLHSTRNFRTGSLQSVMSTYSLENSDKAKSRIPSLTGQTGAMFTGFNERFRDPTAEVPELAAFAGRTIPPARMNVNDRTFQLILAPNAKGKSPEPFTVNLGDPNRMFDPVIIADQSVFYPYPCTRFDRPQLQVNLPLTTTGDRTPRGMIYRIDVRRTPTEIGGGISGYPTTSQTPLTVLVGCVVSGQFRTYSTIIIGQDENSKSLRVTYPTWGAPVAYRCDADPDICVTALFVPIVHLPRDAWVYPARFKYVNGHLWISDPPLADDYNGLAAFLAKV